MITILQSCFNRDDPHDSIVAYVGDEVFTTADLTEALKHIPKSNQFEYLTEDGKKMLVEMLIDWKLLSREAEKTGLDKNPDIAACLDSQPTSKLYREQTLGNAYLQYHIEQMEPVGDAEIERYFLNNRKDFMTPARIRIKRIFFDAKEKAREAAAVLNSGKCFEKYKRQNPKVTIKIDSIWLQSGKQRTTLEHAAGNLAIGETSDAIATKTGYGLIRVEEKIPAKNRTLEEVRESIFVRLNSQKKQDLVKNIRMNVRQDVEIKVDDILIKSYQCRECG